MNYCTQRRQREESKTNEFEEKDRDVKSERTSLGEDKGSLSILCPDHLGVYAQSPLVYIAPHHIPSSQWDASSPRLLAFGIVRRADRR